MNQGVVGYGCIALSVAAHVSALVGTQQLAPPHTAPVLPALELVLPDPPAPVAPPPPPPLPVQPAKPEPQRRPPLPAAPRAAVPEPPTPPPPAEPELTGRTLTSPDDASWAAPAGNGEARSGPIQTARHAPLRRPSTAPASAATSSQPPPAVPFSQLSRKPVPPPLAAALERNYPALARAQGRSGEAKVRALIDAQGRIRSAAITSESATGFGAACQKTLLESRWTPPLGQHGEPSSTFVSYRCKFQVHD